MKRPSAVGKHPVAARCRRLRRMVRHCTRVGPPRPAPNLKASGPPRGAPAREHFTGPAKPLALDRNGAFRGYAKDSGRTSRKGRAGWVSRAWTGVMSPTMSESLPGPTIPPRAPGGIFAARSKTGASPAMSRRGR